MERSETYVIEHAVKTYAEAVVRAHAVVREMARRQPINEGEQDPPLVVLEEGQIPPENAEPNSFLGLHFEHGHALIPDRAGRAVLFFALYYPYEVPLVAATTRLVDVCELARQRAWGPLDDVQTCLHRYAAERGSRWDWAHESGHRVSCFARILDGLTPPYRLTNFRTLARDEWYTASHGGNELATEEEEFQFYRSCGVNLEPIEQRLVLRPGDLLVVNNVRTIHGRIGSRPSGALRQILFGIPNAPRNTLTQISSRVLSLFAQDSGAACRAVLRQE